MLVLTSAPLVEEEMMVCWIFQRCLAGKSCKQLGLESAVSSHLNPTFSKLDISFVSYFYFTSDLSNKHFYFCCKGFLGRKHWFYNQ